MHMGAYNLLESRKDTLYDSFWGQAETLFDILDGGLILHNFE